MPRGIRINAVSPAPARSIGEEIRRVLPGPYTGFFRARRPGLREERRRGAQWARSIVADRGVGGLAADAAAAMISAAITVSPSAAERLDNSATMPTSGGPTRKPE